MKKLLIQIIKFGIVGGIAFLIDYLVLWLLTDICGVWYLASAMISFTVSVIFNYIASMRFVFEARDGMSKRKQFILFVFLSLIGLGINELGMWLLVEFADMHYMWAKIVTTVIVMVYNFITRKLLLEKK